MQPAPLDPVAARQFATEIVQTLRSAGHESYWAGGCVRDEILGKIPVDYDVATAALPEKVRDLFGRRRTLAIGVAPRSDPMQAIPTDGIQEPSLLPTPARMPCGEILQ
ncbi:MAG: hypothetical protein NTX02_08265 [Planctomycetia bacterium]|nr:hypothetical protein [Planctomycetia bacterium]